MIELEQWRPMIEFQGYEISNFGNGRRVAHISITIKRSRYPLKAKTLKRFKYSNGYEFFSIKQKGYLVHRLVAILHIPNPNNLPCVNHKDGDKSNNKASNLEWVTYSQNHRHAYRELGRISHWKGKTGRKHGKSKEVERLNDNGDVIEIFESARDAAINLGVSLGGVGKSIREKYKVKGFRHRYKEL